MKKFVAGFFTALVFFAVVGIAVAWTVDVAATNKPNMLEAKLAHISAHAIRSHAESKKNPFANDPDAAEQGLDHYKENCLTCHGAPGIEPGDLAKGLHPSPPDLSTKAAQDFTDAELYWITANGIMMTGMPGFAPTHDEKAMWQCVAFLRHLPKLTPNEVAELTKGGVMGKHEQMDMSPDEMKK